MVSTIAQGQNDMYQPTSKHTAIYLLLMKPISFLMLNLSHFIVYISNTLLDFQLNMKKQNIKKVLNFFLNTKGSHMHPRNRK